LKSKDRHGSFHLWINDMVAGNYKNSSGDEIANVDFFTTSHKYFKIPKKRTYFV